MRAEPTTPLPPYTGPTPHLVRVLIALLAGLGLAGPAQTPGSTSAG
jgi:hypothetical protein